MDSMDYWSTPPPAFSLNQTLTNSHYTHRSQSGCLEAFCVLHASDLANVSCSSSVSTHSLSSKKLLILFEFESSRVFPFLSNQRHNYHLTFKLLALEKNCPWNRREKISSTHHARRLASVDRQGRIVGLTLITCWWLPLLWLTPFPFH
jgi:hypothetical protein